MGKSRPAQILFTFAAAAIGSSAYVVFSNTCKQLPVSVSYFWFSLIACLTLVIWSSRTERPTLAMIVQPYADRSQRGYLLAASLCLFGFFVCILGLLRKGADEVVIAVVFLELSPLLITIGSRIWFKDDCKNWAAFGIGALLAVGGVILFQLVKESRKLNYEFNNQDAYVALGAMICEAGFQLFALKLRRNLKMSPRHVQLGVNLFAVFAGMTWMLYQQPTSIFPDAYALGGLIYLGVVPTALTQLIIMKAQDELGVPLVETIVAPRPFYVALIGLVPFSWFALKPASLNLWSGAAILLSLVGIAIVFLIAQPKALAKE